MGYMFRGFVTRDADAANAAARRWPQCEVKHVREQMNGFVARCPTENDLHPTDGDDDWERAIEDLEIVRSGLLSLSAEFPAAFLIYIEVTCFGGTCTHEGFHAQHGEVLKIFEAGDNEADLAEIHGPLCVDLGADQFFKPFTRGYFERDRSHARRQPDA